MITWLQRLVARTFFALPESAGFAVAGGAALNVRDLVNRPTRDLDLFTSPAPGMLISAVAAAYERSAQERGWTVRRIHVTETFARLVTDTGAESLIVDIGIDSRPTRRRP
ncbi:nucleotidyl transferase AbiEii/AbiGii toxin family protein [Protofrankia symbiont of Coriaria ruscifolia]|uniref:nucleotidyl transferase AbiEii/AbiGii toxin family protein n=1 Tax=Protofrankia symbiont of Coriaria ruscifolia TaxID=1306542 RepID=UPI0013EF6250|nr:nucleotidyl transferase AbiEii/AbiGii toxin family protein [Protofrankia symbiont of Coriaria ruscifolia]